MQKSSSPVRCLRGPECKWIPLFLVDKSIPRSILSGRGLSE